MWPLTIAFLVWYFAYVLLSSFATEFMSTPVFGAVNVGLLMGLGQFVTTFGITMWYVSYANRRLDPVSAEIRADLEALGVRHDVFVSEAALVRDALARD